MPDPEDRAFLQRAVGYSLTGEVTEHVLLVVWGTGANGKSVFLRTVQHVFGSYAQQAPVDLFVVKRPGSGGATPEIARLAGARFVAATETEQGARLAEALVKQLTGGDRAVARQLYQGYVEFDPTHKLWLTTNHKPQVRSTDEAMWRRLRVLPFGVTIPEDERDPDLYAKLITEAPGILRWAVQGLRHWQCDGLGDSPSVRAATEEYRKESDLIGQFIEECCVVGPKHSGTASDLYRAYDIWARNGGLRPWAQQSFGRTLGERGFVNRRVGANKTHTWFGIALNRGSQRIRHFASQDDPK
jgi:putative DNA primase/helicase